MRNMDALPLEELLDVAIEHKLIRHSEVGETHTTLGVGHTNVTIGNDRLASYLRWILRFWLSTNDDV